MTVSQIKTVEKDGYASMQVAFDTPNKKSNKAMLGHLKSSKATAKRMREVVVSEGVELGSVMSPADHIAVGTVVNIQGTSKGKGFAGVMKRWNFAGGPRTHGQSDRGRAPGSIGQGTTPGRVHKGKKMAGRMGSYTKTVKNAVVVYFDASTNIAWVTGPVPGTISGIVRLTTVGTKELEEVTYNSATAVAVEGVGTTEPVEQKETTQ
jgi:large subunit ribosomal protein L3